MAEKLFQSIHGHINCSVFDPLSPSSMFSGVEQIEPTHQPKGTSQKGRISKKHSVAAFVWACTPESKNICQIQPRWPLEIRFVPCTTNSCSSDGGDDVTSCKLFSWKQGFFLSHNIFSYHSKGSDLVLDFSIKGCFLGLLIVIMSQFRLSLLSPCICCLHKKTACAHLPFLSTWVRFQVDVMTWLLDGSWLVPNTDIGQALRYLRKAIQINSKYEKMSETESIFKNIL